LFNFDLGECVNILSLQANSTLRARDLLRLRTVNLIRCQLRPAAAEESLEADRAKDVDAYKGENRLTTSYYSTADRAGQRGRKFRTGYGEEMELRGLHTISRKSLKRLPSR